MKNLYLRFLALKHAVESPASDSCIIDETANRLLEVIALSAANEKPLTVTDAMAMSSIASPATIHRKLDSLRTAGLIEQTFEGKNRRTKYLVPTKTADEYFAKLGSVMGSAAEKVKPATLDTRHSTLDTRHSTLDTRHSTRNFDLRKLNLKIFFKQFHENDTSY